MVKVSLSTKFCLTTLRQKFEHKIKPRDFIPFVKRKPESIGDVDISEVEDIFTITNLNLVNAPMNNISSLRDVHKKSLLSNDAFHLLTMKYLNIKNIATNDNDFEQIKEITIWKPNPTAKPHHPENHILIITIHKR